VFALRLMVYGNLVVSELLCVILTGTIRVLGGTGVFVDNLFASFGFLENSATMFSRLWKAVAGDY